MNTNSTGWQGRVANIYPLLLGVLLAGAWPSAAQPAATPKTNETKRTVLETKPEEPLEYNNWLTLGGGSYFIDGDKAQFQRRQGVRGGPFGGIEDFHYEVPVQKKGIFQIDGRGIFDNHDYSLKLELSHPDKGYVKAGYRQFRTYYDGSGGFFPVNGQWISLYDEQLAMDRGEAWFEAGLMLPDKPKINFRYSHQFRNGNKDSTSWGDSGLVGLGTATRGIVPTFLDIDETRDIFQGDIKHTLGKTDLGLGLSYELLDNDNSRNIRRRPPVGPTIDRVVTPPLPARDADRMVTQREGVTSDMFNVHAFSETRFNDKVWFTTGYSFTKLDTDISGSRIYGADYDAIYDPTPANPYFPRRQQRDEGFLNLTGGSTMNQYVMNLNLMVVPVEHLTLVPSFRVERQDQEGVAAYDETDIGPGTPAPPFAPTTPVSLLNTRERGFLDVSEALDLRYTGIRNWSLYAKGEWLQGDGDLKETETEAQTGLVNRDTDSSRFTQKYSVGANWYPLTRLNLGGQYYYKSRQNEYDHLVDSTSNATTSGDRYPAFLREQGFHTHDMNVRVTWRALANLTLVTRYDFQLSTIDTRADLLPEVQSAEMTTHIISQSFSWSPLARLFLQGSFSYALDEMRSAAYDVMVGGVNLVLPSQNDYFNASFIAGLALNEKTDLQAQYSYYRADNYVNNALASMPYGADAEEHGITVALIRQITKSLRWTLKYGFFSNRDRLFGGHNDYDAHLVYSSLQFRF